MFKALILALVVSSGGFASVSYDFSGQGSFGSTPFTFSFETVAPTFFTDNVSDVPTTECSLQPAPTGGVDCADIDFFPDGSTHSDFSFAEISLIASGGDYNWFFDLGSFDAPGVYSTVAGAFEGQLQVATIPEPASFYLCGLTALALVLVVYRQKRPVFGQISPLRRLIRLRAHGISGCIALLCQEWRTSQTSRLRPSQAVLSLATES